MAVPFPSGHVIVSLEAARFINLSLIAPTVVLSKD